MYIIYLLFVLYMHLLILKKEKQTQSKSQQEGKIKIKELIRDISNAQIIVSEDENREN